MKKNFLITFCVVFLLVAAVGVFHFKNNQEFLAFEDDRAVVEAQGSNWAYTRGENDIRLLAHVIHGEARGEPYVGKVAIASVVLNRVKHPSFPNTIAGVIFQPGAFTAVSDGQMWLEPNASARRAAIDALNGWDPSGGALYYWNPVTSTSRWIWSRSIWFRIGKHVFGS